MVLPGGTVVSWPRGRRAPARCRAGERRLNIHLDPQRHRRRRMRTSRTSASRATSSRSRSRGSSTRSRRATSRAPSSRGQRVAALHEELIAALQDSWSKYQTTEGIRTSPRAPPHDLHPGLQLGAACASPSSPTSTRTSHALEAVLAAIDARAAGRALVPRRPRRLRRAAERVLRARRGACKRLPRAGITISRCAARSTCAEFSGDAGAAAAWTRDVLDATTRSRC